MGSQKRCYRQFDPILFLNKSSTVCTLRTVGVCVGYSNVNRKQKYSFYK